MTDNYWHTGEPTEDGWYVCIRSDGQPSIIQFVVLKNVYKQLIAWHKLPPYTDN